MKKKRKQTVDLNSAEGARRYLEAMESAGKLSFEDVESSALLTDDEAIDAAALVFLKLNHPDPGKH